MFWNFDSRVREGRLRPAKDNQPGWEAKSDLLSEGKGSSKGHMRIQADIQTDFEDLNKISYKL